MSQIKSQMSAEKRRFRALDKLIHKYYGNLDAGATAVFATYYKEFHHGIFLITDIQNEYCEFFRLHPSEERIKASLPEEMARCAQELDAFWAILCLDECQGEQEWHVLCLSPHVFSPSFKKWETRFFNDSERTDATPEV
jgi:hypothetical protein